ncbi:hypothetical protein [Paraburkholderia youngii]|uniref:Uncharacterized protein n=1 Tax=Paraburkholderia youngii TaxID=2782701 RepID=A0ABX2NPV3_9BURK|nr:hypothetical protein [Paraburkholderia youngii]NVI06387.1 hypothetical protein [Paraburkholderia youngii]
MPINELEIPTYVVLIDEQQEYKLNSDRQILGRPSQELIAFARANGINMSIDARAWDQFARDTALSPIERERHCCYILPRGNETEAELQHLIDL